jgi:hypothetical protein
MKLGRPIPFLVALAGLAAIAGSLSTIGARAPSETPIEIRPAWNEFQWPFPLDQWGIGRAFVCKSADCGSEVNIFLRPKFGFCNCTTDVFDDTELADAELARVGDTGLIAPEAVASGPGRSIGIAWMKGRSRIFDKAAPTRAKLLSIAFHDRCDLMVAVATFAPGNQNDLEPAVIAFLSSDRVLRWVKWLTL